MRLSVVIITKNEEENLGRTLRSVQPLVANGQGEIIIVDSGSTDRTCEIAREFGAKVFVEEWKGFAGQKNSAIAKASGGWVLSLDADEEVSAELVEDIGRSIRLRVLSNAIEPLKEADSLDLVEQEMAHEEAGNHQSGVRHSQVVTELLRRRASAEVSEASSDGFFIPRRNYFVGRWIRHGGFYPDAKLRLFRRGAAEFENRPVHEDVKLSGPTGRLHGDLIHHAYPTLERYIEHMNRYSSLGAEIAIGKGQTSRSWPVFFFNTFIRPRWTFIWNYFFRLGFLDGREGYLLHFYHAVYVSWKYAKAWEKNREPRAGSRESH